MFEVLDFINDYKIDLVIGEDVADKFGRVGLLEFLEVENEIVMVVAIYADFTAFFLVNDAVGIDLGDRNAAWKSLNLSKEQKGKITEINKSANEKKMKILTAEQRSQLEKRSVSVSQ